MDSQLWYPTKATHSTPATGEFNADLLDSWSRNSECRAMTQKLPTKYMFPPVSIFVTAGNIEIEQETDFYV